MNDSLDLRNRILKMRESNNLTHTKKDPLNNDLMLKFESSIKDDNQRKSNTDRNFVNDKDIAPLAKSIENNSDNLNQKAKPENKNPKRNFNDNEAQFLMLANKFNEAVEVILELSEKVEKLERNVSQYPHKLKNNIKSSYFNFKIFVFLLLIPVVVIGFFTLPFDLSFIKTIIIDILSALWRFNPLNQYLKQSC